MLGYDVGKAIVGQAPDWRTLGALRRHVARGRPRFRDHVAGKTPIFERPCIACVMRPAKWRWVISRAKAQGRRQGAPLLRLVGGRTGTSPSANSTKRPLFREKKRRRANHLAEYRVTVVINHRCEGAVIDYVNPVAEALDGRLAFLEDSQGPAPSRRFSGPSTKKTCESRSKNPLAVAIRRTRRFDQSQCRPMAA